MSCPTQCMTSKNNTADFSLTYGHICLNILMEEKLNMMVRIFVVGLAFTVVAFAATPVATISSASSFELHGVTVRTDGVPSWPMMAGDEIATADAPAVIQFRDGSRVTLAGGSRAKVEKSGESLIFRLLTGSMQFLVVPSSSVQVYKQNTAVGGPSGSVSTGGTSKPVLVPLDRRPPPPPISKSS